MNYIFPLLFPYFTHCFGANILYAVPYPAKSHDIFLRPIGLELARRGHNVTTITLYEEVKPPPNYHQVIIDHKEIWKLLGSQKLNVFDMNKLSTTNFLNNLWRRGLAFTEYLLNTTTMQDFLKHDNKFDLVISEHFLIDATTILAYKYNAPLVLVATIGNSMRHNIAVGNPLHMSYFPYEYTFIDDPTSLIGRMKNLYITAYEYFWWRYWYLEERMNLITRYIPDLPQPLPSLYEIHRNASLFLVNSHFSFYTPKAHLPNIIQIGGVHLVSNSEVIPEDIEKILNESKRGVIYINFGSVVQSVHLSVEKKNAFLRSLEKLNYTVLWKWEELTMDGKPANVITRKWFPQKKILEHPNVKLFICHGGMMGLQEAIYHGVPMLGIPVYGDQYYNLYIAKQAGYGKILKYDDVNEDSLIVALNDITHNTSYAENARRTSLRFKDRPVSSLDTAVFWIEYVLKSNVQVLKEIKLDNNSGLLNEVLDISLCLIVIGTLLWIITKISIICLRNVRYCKQTRLKIKPS